MTGDTIKSDRTMDSRYRSEGRPSLPRRRVATKTSHENGDFEMELSLAIKESLKYAKEKEGELKRVDKTSPLLNGVKSDESFSRMAGKMLSLATSSDEGQGSEEVQQLKDLLLIHIELIQHQQELLANKDKDIRLLRNEKDALQCRLLKTEKRLGLLKQREEVLETQIANIKGVAAAAEAAAISAQARPPEKNKVVAKAEQTPTRKRRQSQKSVPRKRLKVKKHSVDEDKTSESVTSEDPEDFDAEDSESGEEEDDVDKDDDKENDASETEGEEASHSGKGDREGEVGIDKNESVEDESDDNKDPHPEPVLRTDCLYYVSCCVELPPEETMDVPDEEVVIGEEVETPGWRINALTNRYQLEGTENITDEAYQKRHQKHEMEEKRRKRWDIQRMREQRVFEKLRGKAEAAASQAQNDESLKSFLPNVEDLTHIEISDSVPVMVFGHAVPHIEPSEFELPWDTGPSSSFTRKSHGGRGRQK